MAVPCIGDSMCEDVLMALTIRVALKNYIYFFLERSVNRNQNRTACVAAAAVYIPVSRGRFDWSPSFVQRNKIHLI